MDRFGASARIALLLATLSLPTTLARAQERVIEGRVTRERCADSDPERRPFFGDLHVHTIFSLDASTMGTRNRPADAYDFAKGEPIGIQPYDAAGQPLRTLQLSRPLDFAAVTDHAELFGEWNICNHPELPGHGSLVCRVYRSWPRLAFFWMNFQASRATRHGFCGEHGARCLEAAREPWQEIQQASEGAYDRTSACRFSTFTGYEWTGGAGPGNNFHRNVIFANDVVPELPISFIDEPRLYEFWRRLGSECNENGSACDVVVIPHNSNLSAGMMFQTVEADGTPLRGEDASSRARYEPLVEIMQHKGDSECMPGLAGADELCSFEKLAMNNFSGRFFPALAEPPLARQFIRNILAEGLEQERRLGTNPFRFGLIASSDTHLGAAGWVEESADYPGHGGAGKPPGSALPVGLPDHIDFNPGGLAVLWAEENSRSALFAAMRRREAYGTSGPRMQVRFFGGWSYAAELCSSRSFARDGYAGGVPMGAELPPRSAGPRDESPIFAASALADPGTAAAPGMPLQRIQIIKGWLEGETTRYAVHELVGDPANGAGVDTRSCETYGEGAGALCGVWRDPDFDPAEPAFYYARVVENPSCRWSQKLCVAAGVRCDDPDGVPDGFELCCAETHVTSIQERAWTSPIWYRPSAP